METQNPDRNEIETLVENLIKYKRAYYEGNPLISDSEYDKFEDKLRQIDPDHHVLKFVGTDKTGKVRHDPLLLSANKLSSVLDIQKWAKKYGIIVGYKIDGLTVKLVYINGKLIQGSTRGNGELGDDITAQAFNLHNVPHEIPELNQIEIRGEAYIPLSTFNNLQGEHKSPRNLATGTIRSKDPKLVKSRGVSFMAFDLINPKLPMDFSDKIKTIKKWGFKNADFRLTTQLNIEKIYSDVCDRRAEFDFEMDGLVFKINKFEIRNQMGNTEHHPRWMTALKFPAKESSTIIKEITWQVGRTGRLTPVAELEPIELAGARLSRATLHNMDFLIKGDYAPGDRVFIVRSGDVIPKIVGMAEKGSQKAFLPEKCPACGGNVRDDGVSIYCDNLECDEKLFRKLQHFIQVTKIEHLGEETQRKLWNKKLIRNPADLFKLSTETLFSLVGKNGTKIFKQIQNKKSLTLPVFLKSLGIHTLSSGMSKTLSKKFGTFEKIQSLSLTDLENIDGIGKITAQSIYSGLHDKSLYEPLFKAGVVVQPFISNVFQAKKTVISGKKIYITGSVQGYNKKMNSQ